MNTQSLMTHTFEQSGLGKAPFKVVERKGHAIESGVIFWCEHCGTQLKNRHFVKSSDGKVSVVGIDCLKKTGDQGLIDGAKRLAREKRIEAKQQEWKANVQRKEAEERTANNGKTNNELIQELEAKQQELRGFYFEKFDTHPVLIALTEFGFEKDMQLHAYLGRNYTPNMVNAIAKCLTRKRTKARANTKAFKAAYPATVVEVKSMAELVAEYVKKNNAIAQRILSLK